MERLSEYIAKSHGALALNLCKSLSESIDNSESNNIAVNLLESDLVVLSELIKELFQVYKSNVMPKIAFAEENNLYTLELDTLKVSQQNQLFINTGGRGRSQRFVAFMFIVGNESNNSKLHFPDQKITYACEQGDVLIFPSYLNHRYLVDLGQNDIFRSVSLYACM